MAGPDLLPRVEAAVDRTIQMVLALPRNVAGQEIGRQVIRSAGSVGANLQEAQGAVSRSDFMYRVSIALKEARETLYWMARVRNNRLLPAGKLGPLCDEWAELVSILTASQKTLKGRQKSGTGM